MLKKQTVKFKKMPLDSPKYVRFRVRYIYFLNLVLNLAKLFGTVFRCSDREFGHFGSLENLYRCDEIQNFKFL